MKTRGLDILIHLLFEACLPQNLRGKPSLDFSGLTQNLQFGLWEQPFWAPRMDGSLCFPTNTNFTQMKTLWKGKLKINNVKISAPSFYFSYQVL